MMKGFMGIMINGCLIVFCAGSDVESRLDGEAFSEVHQTFVFPNCFASFQLVIVMNLRAHLDG
jgi:hypothetical protein